MFQLKICQCSRDEADALSDVLEDMGALSVTLTDRYDSPILEPELGTTPLWADVVIQALYDDEREAQLVLSHIALTYPRLEATLDPVASQDWERVCLADFKPQQFGQRLWVCPSWLTPPPELNAIHVTLDPGLAFGTGTHPTTALCLTWLEQSSLAGKRVIDYGCGSGILAIAALKLGASHVTAVDLDVQALIATRSNAVVNQIAACYLTVSFPDVSLEPADILIANILLTPLMQLQQRFRHLLHTGGLLVVSGILNEQVVSLVKSYQNDFSHVVSVSQEGWSLVVFKR